MAILHKKPIKAQTGYIFKSLEEAKSSNPGYAKIRTKNPGSTITRCVGAAHDAAGLCGVNYRAMVSKGYDDKTMRLKGENDAIVDAWNWKDAAYNTDEIDILYDRERDGLDVLEKLRKDLPLNAFIGTGDARGKYISEDNARRARHGIVNLGYLEDGTPIIYDLTKFKAGIPAKYSGQINYIAVPKGGGSTTFSSLSGVQNAGTDLPKKDFSPVKDMELTKYKEWYQPVNDNKNKGKKKWVYEEDNYSINSWLKLLNETFG